MRTHVEWLVDCHHELVRAFEEVRGQIQKLSGFDQALDRKDCEIVIFVVHCACHDLEFNEIDDALEFFAVVYSAKYFTLVDGQYASYHEALYSPIKKASNTVRSWLEANPDDWVGAVDELRNLRADFERIVNLLTSRSGGLRAELADAINEAAGRFGPIPAELKQASPSATDSEASGTDIEVSEFVEADLKNNRVRVRTEWYSTSADAALLIDYLIKAQPEWFPAGNKFSKPSRTKKSLPNEVQNLIETSAGKGYRLKLPPNAPEMRRNLPGSTAQK